jgi:hypothetical protein
MLFISVVLKCLECPSLVFLLLVLPIRVSPQLVWLLASGVEEIDCRAYQVDGNGVVAEQLQGLLLSPVEPARLEVAETGFPHSRLVESQMAFVKVLAYEETMDSNTAMMEAHDQPNIRNAAWIQLKEVVRSVAESKETPGDVWQNDLGQQRDLVRSKGQHTEEMVVAQELVSVTVARDLDQVRFYPKMVPAAAATYHLSVDLLMIRRASVEDGLVSCAQHLCKYPMHD